MSDLVSGEAVVLDLRLARLASRGLAFAIDVVVQAIVLLGVVLLLAGPTDLDGALFSAVALSLVVAVLVGYPVLAETLSRGRTLGKLALGLRVVREDGGPIRFRHALVRGLAGFFVDFWALGLGGAVAVFVSLASAKGKRVGDYLAGTVVVRERQPRSVDAELVMPPWLAGWAGTLELTGVTDPLALAVRQYLLRVGDLTPAAAAELGGRLAAQVGGRIGTAGPPGVSPRDYLTAVLVERRSRELAALARRTTAHQVDRPGQPAHRSVPEPDRQHPFTPPG